MDSLQHCTNKTTRMKTKNGKTIRKVFRNKLSLKFVSISILILIVFIDFENVVAGSDAPLYTAEKSIVVRPAKRLPRIRPGTRRRILIHRVPVLKQRIPVGTSVRRIVSTQKIPAQPTSTRHYKVLATAPKLYENTTVAVKQVPSTTEPAPTESTVTDTTQRQTTTMEGRRSQTWSTTRRSRNRNLSVLHALMRANTEIDYADLLKKLDYFIAYYPTVREGVARFTNLLTRHEQTSREERRRIWKGVFRVKSEMRKLRGQCDSINRNLSQVIGKVGRQAQELSSYQKTAKKKIEQIEIHQGSQDDQYFEVYQLSVNNTKDLSRLGREMEVLLPLVTSLIQNNQRNSLQETRALKELDTIARGNIADMTNQILVQQNHLANLGNQVRSEMDLLHAQKQSMSKSMEQHQRRLTNALNSQLSSQLSQLTKIDGSLNRQAEKIKYFTTVISNHERFVNSVNGGMFNYGEEIQNISQKLSELRKNMSRLMDDSNHMMAMIESSDQAITKMKKEADTLSEQYNHQNIGLNRTFVALQSTNEAIQTTHEEFKDYQLSNEEEFERLRDNIDEILEKQRLYEANLTASRQYHQQYPSDEPSPESESLVSPQQLQFALAEIGIEDRMSRLTRVLRHQQQRMSNVTRAVLRVAEDNEAIAMTTSHYFSLINTQAKVIRDQNATIGKLTKIAANQGETIKTLSTDLGDSQETVMKLTNIITNLASQLRSPIGSQRDCHDVWQNGNRRSGVYNVIEGMNLRPVFCNLTDYGGWTVIQRRKDGSKNFDKSMKDYRQGFGDVYGEYWVGLETLRTLSGTRISNTLHIILEDWDGNIRTATYNKFYVYGQGYSVQVSEYSGDAGDSLSPHNGRQFSTRKDNANERHGSHCPETKTSGWWFIWNNDECGNSNLNGLYKDKYDWGEHNKASIHWDEWRGKDYSLKSVTMQIIPSEVWAKKTNANEETPPDDNVDINGRKATKNVLRIPVPFPAGNPGLSNIYTRGSSYQPFLNEGDVGHGKNNDYDLDLLLAEG